MSSESVNKMTTNACSYRNYDMACVSHTQLLILAAPWSTEQGSSRRFTSCLDNMRTQERGKGERGKSRERGRENQEVKEQREKARESQ